MSRRPAIARPDSVRGFTLIELMIAMLLGLVIVGSVMGVMLANQRTNRTNQGLTQVQETARTAFELLAHDLRQGDSTGCGPSNRIANVLDSTTAWWQTWFGIRGYDSSQTDPAITTGTATANRVAGTDSIHVESMDGTGFAVAQHANGSYRIDLDASAATPDFVTADIMIICDHDHATVFEISATGSSAGTFSVYHDNVGGSPGNCSRGLGFPTSCSSTVGNSYVFPRNAQVGRLSITDWYIGNNGRAAEGGSSLYRRRMNTGGSLINEEIVAGVTDMQLRFRATDTDAIIADASLVTDWSTISTVLITLTVQSGDVTVSSTPGTNSGRIQRTFNYIVSLRNRLP